MSASPELLLRRAVDGDHSAFESLLAPYRGRLLAAIRLRLHDLPGSDALAEDLLQETVLRAYEALPRFEWSGEERFAGWLLTIARNQAGMAIRRHKRTPGRVDHEALDELPGHQEFDRSSSPLVRMRREERFDRLAAAFAELPPDYREVLTLSRIDGLPVKAVAERIGRSRDATAILLLRALRKLGSIFGDTESLGLPPWSLRESAGDPDPDRGESDASP